jgi:hypothetical protein
MNHNANLVISLWNLIEDYRPRRFNESYWISRKNWLLLKSIRFSFADHRQTELLNFGREYFRKTKSIKSNDKGVHQPPLWFVFSTKLLSCCMACSLHNLLATNDIHHQLVLFIINNYCIVIVNVWTIIHCITKIKYTSQERQVKKVLKLAGMIKAGSYNTLNTSSIV